MVRKMHSIHWLEEPEEHDYPAAQAYLSLIYDPLLVHNYINGLRHAPITEYKAKDVFRASGLSLLGVSNSHIKHNLKKIEAGEKLSPILLVRAHNRVIIADGYHRLCAVYRHDEDALIPCKIV